MTLFFAIENHSFLFPKKWSCSGTLTYLLEIVLKIELTRKQKRLFISLIYVFYFCMLINSNRILIRLCREIRR